jgi:predicted SAM-dependent methyltransferase
MNSTLNIEKTSIYNKDYQVSLLGILYFEFKSLYGRLLLNSKLKLKSGERNLLNLGCGKTQFKNWVNADFFVVKNNNKPDWMLDLRFPLNCDDNVWDGVFTEHTIEHLYPDQALQLLQELYRTMKPGAWLRVTVPDLRKYVSYYCGQEVNEKFNQWETGCEAIRTLTQDYIHLSVWDSELLGNCLKSSGFVNIKEVSFNEGTDILLLKDKEERAWETLYMEAQKP